MWRARERVSAFLAPFNLVLLHSILDYDVHAERLKTGAFDGTPPVISLVCVDRTNKPRRASRRATLMLTFKWSAT